MNIYIHIYIHIYTHTHSADTHSHTPAAGARGGAPVEALIRLNPLSLSLSFSTHLQVECVKELIRRAPVSPRGIRADAHFGYH